LGRGLDDTIKIACIAVTLVSCVQRGCVREHHQKRMN
jgi:hypothetical protein